MKKARAAQKRPEPRGLQPFASIARIARFRPASARRSTRDSRYAASDAILVDLSDSERH
jgi:hypothetical protein